MDTKILTTAISNEWQYFENFLSYMPDMNEFLSSINENYDVYNKMLMDDEIGASLDLRKRMLRSYDFSLMPSDHSDFAKKIADEITSYFAPIFPELLQAMQMSLEYGFSVTEVIYRNRDGLWIIDKLLPLKITRFRFDKDGNLVLIHPQVKNLDAKFKLIIHRHGIMPESFYGISVLNRCYWPWRFKKAGLKFWLIAAEKFGVPSIIALFQTKNEKEAINRAQHIAEMLSNLKTDAAAALANVDNVMTIETKGTFDFSNLIKLCDRAIAKTITGQTLATNEAEYGSRAQAEMHMQTLINLVDSDANDIATTLNKTLIPWLTELNYGVDAPVPLFTFDLTDQTPWERVRDAIDRGLPLSKSKIYSMFNLPAPLDNEDIFISTKSMNFADLADKEDHSFFSQAPRQRRLRLFW